MHMHVFFKSMGHNSGPDTQTQGKTHYSACNNWHSIFQRNLQAQAACKRMQAAGGGAPNAKGHSRECMHASLRSAKPARQVCLSLSLSLSFSLHVCGSKERKSSLLLKTKDYPHTITYVELGPGIIINTFGVNANLKKISPTQ